MRLKEFRKAKNLTQAEVAAAIGITTQVFSRYERGDHEPDNKTLCKLADFFGVSVDELLGRTPQLFDDARVPKTEVQELFDQLSVPEQQQVIGYMKGMLYQKEARRKTV